MLRKELLKVFKSARLVCRFPEFDIKKAPTAHPVGELIVITPKKVGNAPQRNKIRRRIKAIFHEQKLYEQGFDWIVYIKKEASQLSFSDILERLLQCSLKG